MFMDHVRDTIVERVRAEAAPPNLVVLDLSAAAHVDMHAAHALAGLAGELTVDGIRLQAVEARSSVRDRLRSEGVEEKLGGATALPRWPTPWMRPRSKTRPETLK